MPEQNKSIVWLHLSDLHFCKAKSGYDMHRVIDALYIDLKKMQDEHGLLPQLMFFTGDAAFGNYGVGAGSTLQEQYQDVEQFLTKVRRLFTVEIPKDNLFLVPGNHDVDRNEVTDDQALWLGQQQDEESVNSLIKQGGKQWQRYMERLVQYRNFLERYEYTHLLGDPERLIYHEVREVNGVKIGIGGFNSAWSCGKDQEKGKLWLGGDWQNGTIIGNLKSKQADLKLALIHHPPGWFVEHEDHVMRRQMERDFDFFLHGHEHQGWVNAGVDGHIRISAAAGYERADQENGYNFVRLNLESGDVEVWLRKYDSSGGGWIPRIIGNGKTTNDGLWLIKNASLAVEFKFKAVSVEGKNTESAQAPSETTKPASIDRGDSGASFAQMKSQNPSPLEKTSAHQSESLTASQQSRQNKLIKRLAEQFQLPELKPVVTSFIEKLQEQDNAELSPTLDNLADYLVNHEYSYDYCDPILLFLLAAGEQIADKNLSELISELFAYLLQTLVRNCELSDDGLTIMPVFYEETLELINACRTTTPIVPSYNKAEFKNARRNDLMTTLGDFQPVTGELEGDDAVHAVCLEIAKKLLKTLGFGEEDWNSPNALNVLNGFLNTYKFNPKDSPLPFIPVHNEQLSSHPLNIPGIAEIFREKTKNQLPLYVFGADGSSGSTDVLHTDEENIRQAIIGHYNKNQIQPESAQSPQEETKMESGIKLGNIGNNAVFNINTGEQNGVQVRQGNIRLAEADTKQLLELLEKLKNTSQEAEDISKSEYAAITKVSQDIEAEIKKPDGIGKTVLATAKKALDGFKDIKSIGETINEITQLLLPIIS